MSSIDQRVVDMKFNNSQFASGVQSTIGMLGRLKASLNLDGAAKSIQNLESAGRGFSLANMATGVDHLASKFSALSVIGVTALATIANKAINAGLTIVKSLTIGPIAGGYSDYNEKLTSVQTIMNATGASIGVVNGYFSQLDTYSDKTIYNLKDMTGAFAKFTNAGVGMDKSVPAIKGIANMVALAGQGADAAGIAMYNLAQSIAGGFLTTTDYKSLNLANVATKEWKNQMISGAVAAGKLKKTGADAYHIVGTKAGTAATSSQLFNEKLSEGWASSEVLLKVLGDYGNETTKIGKKSLAAAQNVKSLPMMMDTLKAAVGTGWTTTFETLLGNVTESTTLFTDLTNTIQSLLDISANARNKLLSDWKALGGRALLIDAVKNSFHGLMAVIKPITSAFRVIFPAMTGQRLKDITKAIDDFTKKFKVSANTAQNIRRTFGGVFAIFSIGATLIKAAIGAILGVFSPFIKHMNLAGDGILGITSRIGVWLYFLNEAVKKSDWFSNTFEKVSNAVAPIAKHISDAAIKIGAFIAVISKAAKSKIGTFVSDIADKFSSLVSVLSGPINAVMGRISSSFDGFKTSISSLVSGPLTTMQDKLAAVRQVVSDFGTAIANFGTSIYEGFQKRFDSANTSVSGFGTSISSSFSSITNSMKGLGSTASSNISTGLQKSLGPLKALGDGILNLWSRIGGIFAHVGDNLKTMGGAVGNAVTAVKDGIKKMIAGADPNVVLGTLNLSIFAAVAIMIKKLFGAVTGGIRSSLVASLQQLTGALKAMQTSLKADALLAIAGAILVLAGAVFVLSLVDPSRLVPAVVAMSAMLTEMLIAMKLLDSVTSSKGFIKIPLLALSLLLLGGALILFAIAAIKFGGMNPEDLKKGLIGIAVALAASNLARGGKLSGFALLLLAFALNSIADALGKMAAIGWDALKNGAVIMGAILIAIAAFGALPFDATRVLIASAAMVILAYAMTALTDVLFLLNAIPWGTFFDGLGKMAIALAAIAAAMSLMPPNMILMSLGLVATAAALTTLSGAIVLFAKIDWSTFAKGLSMIGITLVVLALGLTAMESALPGAAALIIAAFALGLLVPVMAAFGNMDWDTILKGLVAIGGILLVLAVGGLALTPIVGTFVIFGAALLLMGAAAVLAGIGLGLMGVGLAAVAASGAVAIPLFIAAIKQLIDMIPVFLTRVGQGIVGIAQVIIASAPTVVGAFTAILLALIVSLAAVIPPLVALVFKLLEALIMEFAKSYPKFLAAGIKILLTFLSGLRANIGRIVTLVVDIITRFINAIANNLPKIIAAGTNLLIKFIQGISNAIPKIVDAAAKAIIRFVNGIATAIDNNAEVMGRAGGRLAGSIVSGMIKGITGGISEVVNAAKRLASGALDAVKGWLHIGSPSKEFEKIGMFSAIGLANGLNKYAGLVVTASEGIGATAIEGMRKSIGNISDVMASDVEMVPVIRPVLDLSAIKKDAGLIEGLLGQPTLALDTTINKASSVAAGRSSSQEPNILPPVTTVAPATTLSFVQNNNSPKALSNAEIYRQTKNQLSVVKGALTN